MPEQLVDTAPSARPGVPSTLPTVQALVFGSSAPTDPEAAELDVMHDEAKGYRAPRPWHESFPLRPKTWKVDLATVNIWGPINEAMLDH